MPPGGGPPIDAPEENFVAEPTPDPEDEWVRFQALVPVPKDVPPGAWSASTVILDRVGGGAATARASFTIEPVRPGVPRLIGPLIADRLARTGDPLPSATRPFRFGEALVTPRMENRVPRAEPFALFVAVEGDQPVALDWSFTREGEPFGTPGHLDDARGIRAWEIKGGTLEPGRYEVRVRARMSEGEAAERTLVFDIAP